MLIAASENENAMCEIVTCFDQIFINRGWDTYPKQLRHILDEGYTLEPLQELYGFIVLKKATEIGKRGIVLPEGFEITVYIHKTVSDGIIVQVSFDVMYEHYFSSKRIVLTDDEKDEIVSWFSGMKDTIIGLKMSEIRKRAFEQAQFVVLELLNRKIKEINDLRDEIISIIP